MIAICTPCATQWMSAPKKVKPAITMWKLIGSYLNPSKSL